LLAIAANEEGRDDRRFYFYWQVKSAPAHCSAANPRIPVALTEGRIGTNPLVRR
jgi:hypothetical protein